MSALAVSFITAHPDAQEVLMIAGEKSVIQPPVLLTVEEAARAMAVGRTTVFQLLAAGSLRSVKIGTARRIPLDAIRDFVSELRLDQAEAQG
jgi:excisionase family DNA binding protein